MELEDGILSAEDCPIVVLPVKVVAGPIVTPFPVSIPNTPVFGASNRLECPISFVSHAGFGFIVPSMVDPADALATLFVTPHTIWVV